MEKYIHIKSNEKALVSINGNKTYHVSKSTPLDIITKKNFYVTIMPTKDEFLPYSFSIADINQNDNILKVPYYNNHLDIYFTPTIKLSDNNEIILLDKKIGNHYIKLFTTTYTYINITNGSYNLTKKIPHFTTCNDVLEKHLIINGKLKNNNLYYFIFDLENNKVVLDDEFEIVEREKEKLKLMKNTQNIANHGIVYDYDIKTGIIDNYSIYLNNNPAKTNIDKAIPYAFIEAIKLEDYNLAKSYLQDTFVSNEHLKSYFGEIKEIFKNPYSKLNNYTILNNKGFKSYNFDIKDSKIIDIEEVSIPTQ